MSALVVVTAYIAACAGCSGVTASGLPADHRLDLVAAGSAYRLGSCVEVEVEPDDRRVYLVADRGGALAPDALDLLVETHRAAVTWGRRTLPARPVPCPARLLRTWDERGAGSR